jgi:hypothetical protein
VAQRCCGSHRVRRIKVGNTYAGITGLDELFQALRREGWRPEQEGLKARVIDGLRKAGNYIAAGYEDIYAETLLALYRKKVTQCLNPDRRSGTSLRPQEK